MSYRGIQGLGTERYPTTIQEHADRNPEEDIIGMPYDPSDYPLPNPDVVAYDDSLPLWWRMEWLSRAALTLPKSSTNGPRGLGPEATSTTPTPDAIHSSPPSGARSGSAPTST